MKERSGMIIVQRDEGLLLRLNVAYHLSMGFSRIVVVDNASEDANTIAILQDLSTTPNVAVVSDHSPVCDQGHLANAGLAVLLSDPEIQWVFPCDADEFIWIDDDLECWLSQRRTANTVYGTLAWLNHIPESRPDAHDSLSYMHGHLFYEPFAERPWQRHNHFRKAFCLRHSGIELVVGGHFFRKEVNPTFFEALKDCPAEIAEKDGVLFHYEMRDCGSRLIQKWNNLARRHRTSGIAPGGPWREKEAWLGVLCERYAHNGEGLFRDFAATPRTLWGSEIPPERLRRRPDFPERLIRAGLGLLANTV